MNGSSPCSLGAFDLRRLSVATERGNLLCRRLNSVLGSRCGVLPGRRLTGTTRKLASGSPPGPLLPVIFLVGLSATLPTTTISRSLRLPRN